jgi:hypothetical protein
MFPCVRGYCADRVASWRLGAGLLVLVSFRWGGVRGSLVPVVRLGFVGGVGVRLCVSVWFVSGVGIRVVVFIAVSVRWSRYVEVAGIGHVCGWFRGPIVCGEGVTVVDGSCGSRFGGVRLSALVKVLERDASGLCVHR